MLACMVVRNTGKGRATGVGRMKIKIKLSTGETDEVKVDVTPKELYRALETGNNISFTIDGGEIIYRREHIVWVKTYV